MATRWHKTKYFYYKPAMILNLFPNQTTIHGLCETDYTVNTREDIATDVTLSRDLSRCDQFRPIKDHTSPLAIITGMVSLLWAPFWKWITQAAC